jgi:hypothetical protein
MSTDASISPIAMMYGDFEAEHAATRRMLERFPDAHRDWRPHEHSRTIAELATHIADIPNRGVAILTTDGMSVYYRLLGVAVPGMYGPSADDLAGRK